MNLIRSVSDISYSLQRFFNKDFQVVKVLKMIFERTADSKTENVSKIISKNVMYLIVF